MTENQDTKQLKYELIQQLKNQEFLAVFDDKDRQAIELIFNGKLLIATHLTAAERFIKHNTDDELLKGYTLEYMFYDLELFSVSDLQRLQNKGKITSISEIEAFLENLNIYAWHMKGEYLNQDWFNTKSYIEYTLLNRIKPRGTTNKQINL